MLKNVSVKLREQNLRGTGSQGTVYVLCSEVSYQLQPGNGHLNIMISMQSQYKPAFTGVAPVACVSFSLYLFSREL